MNKQKEKIAITKNGKDYVRIIPIGSEKNKAEIKLSFFDTTFTVRNFTQNKNVGGFLYRPLDQSFKANEITYHNSNEDYSEAALMPKYKNIREREPISQELIDLDLKNLIVPIPICRITVNQESKLAFNEKKYHQNIDLSSKYNTTEIFISSEKYDPRVLSKRFPYIVDFLFPMTTIDYLIYGAGLASEPIMKKMFGNNDPIVALNSCLIKNYRFYYRTYKLSKDPLLYSSDDKYHQNNMIAFYNNIDYLDLLATTDIGLKIEGSDKYDVKPAYKRDIENLKKIGFHKGYIKRWNNRFQKKEREYKQLKNIRSGIILG